MQTRRRDTGHTALAGGCHNGPCPEESSRARSGSHMHSLSFHVGAELRAQRLIGYQINRAAQQVFNVELDTEVRP